MKRFCVLAFAVFCIAGFITCSKTADAAGSAGQSGPADGSVAWLDDAVGLKNGAFFENVPQASKNYQIANVTRTLMNAHWIKEKEGFEAAAKYYGVTGETFAV